MPLIVIVGINGRQGTAVANAFLDVENVRIRGLTSSPSCPASDNWRALGVEIREEDFRDEEHTRASLDGAAYIFASTSTLKHRKNPRIDAVQLAGYRHSPDRLATERDVYTSKVLLDAAAATNGLQRLVLSTLPVTLSGAKYATHFAQGTHHAKMEQIRHLKFSLPGLNSKTVFVKPALPMEDYRLTLRTCDDGSLSFGTTAPGDLPMYWINMSNDFGPYVRSLVRRLPQTSFPIAAFSDQVSGNDICALISEISGLTCDYKQYTMQEMETERFEKDIVSDLLPSPPGSLLYDQLHITPTKVEGELQKFQESVQYTRFKDYLKAELLRHIATLKTTPSDAPAPEKEDDGTNMDAVNTAFAAGDIRAITEGDGAEMHPALWPATGPELGDVLLNDLFMGFPWDEKMQKEYHELMEQALPLNRRSSEGYPRR